MAAAGGVAKWVVRARTAAGVEGRYTGRRKTRGEIAQLALDEEADVSGLSSLAGSHILFCRKLKALLDQYGLNEKLWVIGGCSPAQDQDELREIGLDGIFPNGSKLADIIEFSAANTPATEEES